MKFEQRFGIGFGQRFEQSSDRGSVTQKLGNEFKLELGDRQESKSISELRIVCTKRRVYILVGIRSSRSSEDSEHR